MLGKYWVTSRENLVSSIKKNMAEEAINRGYDIVVDNMNLNPKEVLFWKDMVKTANMDPDGYQYEIEFKDFFIPLEECIRRDAARPNPIGEKVIRETWKRYKHFIQTTEVEKHVDSMRRYTGKPKCIVIDMDSTMCFNVTKRPWYGDGAAEGMLNDIPNTGVVDIVRDLSKIYSIVVATGRDTTQAEVTKEWLAKQGIEADEYFFRTPRDYRKGVEVKKEQITDILEEYDVVAIFEDCEPIVQMYREMGLTVLQPNKGI